MCVAARLQCASKASAMPHCDLVRGTAVRKVELCFTENSTLGVQLRWQRLNREDLKAAMSVAGRLDPALGDRVTFWGFVVGRCAHH